MRARSPPRAGRGTSARMRRTSRGHTVAQRSGALFAHGRQNAFGRRQADIRADERVFHCLRRFDNGGARRRGAAARRRGRRIAQTFTELLGGLRETGFQARDRDAI